MIFENSRETREDTAKIKKENSVILTLVVKHGIFRGKPYYISKEEDRTIF